MPRLALQTLLVYVQYPQTRKMNLESCSKPAQIRGRPAPPAITCVTDPCATALSNVAAIAAASPPPMRGWWRAGTARPIHAGSCAADRMTGVRGF